MPTLNEQRKPKPIRNIRPGNLILGSKKIKLFFWAGKNTCFAGVLAKKWVLTIWLLVGFKRQLIQNQVSGRHNTDEFT
jgi:hypothetical protein